MPRRRLDGTTPSWSALCRLAGPQRGYFNRLQAHEAGYSRQLLQYYIQRALIERTGHDGVFHLKRYPPGEREDLWVLWLTTECRGVFSHETALWMHGLIDGTPEQHTMTLPRAWRRRRRPDGVICHVEEVPDECLEHLDALPLTSVLRSLSDCLLRASLAGGTGLLSPMPPADPVLRRAISRAVQRGLCTRPELRRLVTERRQTLLAVRGR